MQELVRRAKGEERWQGLGVSDGIVVGRVLRIFTGTRQVYRASLLDVADVERETERLRAAIRLARRQLLAIKERAEKELGAEHAYIFDAHLLMLEDRKLLDDVEAHIRTERVNAEWAVKVAADRLLAVYAEIKDDYLRERGSDIEDVAQRILVALSGASPGYRNLTEDAVIVAEDLPPSAVAELDFQHARAIATDVGGWTSHTAIIARGLGIPAVVGMRDLHRRARTGDEIVVDAIKGEVILHPSEETSRNYQSIAASSNARAAVVEERHGPAVTLDGVKIYLRANVELPAEFDGVRRFGALGVGLYRSEFLLSQRGFMPSEDDQCNAYVEVAELAGESGATVRLFDLGGDKISGTGAETERNPALGLRAIRFGLRHIDILRTQVRAILRASAKGRLDIVLPMVADVLDVRRAKKVIDEERERLRQEGALTGSVRVGAMIEVPSAVLTARRIAREVDFFSLGTNDLVQYLLAVDRGNDEVADWFRSLHPVVLQSIRQTVEAAREANIPAVVCGEMAAGPAYSVILVGLGATDFSMAPTSIPRVRRTVAGVTVEKAREIAGACLECETADEVEDLVRERLGAEWPNLFSPETLPPKRDEE